MVCHGDSLVDKGIQATTGQDANHVLLADWVHNRLMAIEALGSGVTFRPFSLLADKEYLRLTVYRANISDFDKNVALANAISHVGKDYDFVQIMHIWLKDVLDIPEGLGENGDSEDKFICSELVLRAYMAAGFHVAGGEELDAITPGDFEESDLLEKVVSFTF